MAPPKLLQFFMAIDPRIVELGCQLVVVGLVQESELLAGLLRLRLIVYIL